MMFLKRPAATRFKSRFFSPQAGSAHLSQNTNLDMEKIREALSEDYKLKMTADS